MIKRSFLYKILAFYISIVLLYTGVTSGIILYKGFQMSHMQANHSNQLYMDQSSNYADSKISIALDFVYKISTLGSLIDYHYSSPTNYIYVTNLYNDLIDHIQGFSQLGFTFGITKITDDMVITPNGTFSYQSYLDELGIDSNSLNTFKDSAIESPSLNTYVVPQSMMKSSSKNMVLIHQPVGTSKLSPIYFFIVLDINSLLPTLTDDALGDFYVYTDELITILINDENVNEEGILNYVSSLAPMENIEHLKINSTVNYVQCSNIVPNLKYIYTVPSASLWPILLSILRTSLIPGILLLLIGIWLAYQAARSSYRPINQLIKLMDGLPTSSQDNSMDINELDYIQQSIKQIYSINDTLQHKLDNSFIRLQEDFFRKVIYGIASEDFIQENLAMLKLEAFRDDLNLILLDCEGVENLHKIIPAQNLSLFIHELISHLPNQTSIFFVLPLDTKKYCIILGHQPQDALCTLSEYIIDKVGIELSLDITACVSSTYKISELTSALQELLMLHNYKYSNANNKVLTAKSIQTLSQAIYYYPIEIETCLINYISTNEFTKSNDLLLELLDKNLKDLTLSPVNITNLKYSLITTFKRCLNADGKTLNQFIKEYPNAIDDFLETPTSHLKESCFTLFETIFNFCNKGKFSLENSTASNIFMYIHENFDKDISLTDIANHFALSESYISKLLKSSLDINFKTYVNTLKVKKAKDLLSQGNYKVNEVATIVGCNNANTFIRIFKQYEGVSPGEYVKSMHKLNI